MLRRELGGGIMRCRAGEIRGGLEGAVRPVSHLDLLPGRLAICRLPPDAPLPVWAAAAPFTSVTRTAYELSVVCTEAVAPEGAECDAGWRIFQVRGPLDFSLTGILAAIAGPLADAGASIFAISTFDTDYVMVKEEKLAQAVDALRTAGHAVQA
jgi:hypothetical protein